MSKSIYQTEYHRIRKAKKFVNNHLIGFGFNCYGLGRDWADYYYGRGVTFHYGRGNISFLARRNAYAFISNNLRNPTMVPSTLTFDDITLWEAQELGQQDELLQAKKWVDLGGYNFSLGGKSKRVKEYRREYNRNWRYRNRRYCHDVLRGVEGEVYPDKDRTFWWYVD